MAPMSTTLLPPGFRFHPTDEELVAYYLDRKINGGIIELQVIPEIDLYKCEPWDLPEKSLIPSKDMEWYFYSPRDRKYPNGSRTNRATRSGYWKATGKDRFVQSQNRPVGMKKTLVYYRGRAPHGIRTDWVMHEYRLIESVLSGTTSSSLKDSYALCRVLKKNTIIPKDKEFESTASGSGQMSMSWDDSAPESSRDQKEDADADDVKNYEFSSKLRSNASSSDLTPIASGPNGDESSPPLIVADEANSSIDQFNYGFGIQDISNFRQDDLIPNYTGIFYENSFYPPLAMEDFPQMEECVNDITALEEIYSLCSSQDNLTYQNCVG